MRTHLKNYFIPYEGNRYHPYSLRKVAMMGMVCMVLLSFALANIQSVLWVESDWMVSTVLPSVIVDLTNQERNQQSLGTLQRNAKLDAAAQMKAEHMAQEEYFAHFSPDGTSPWYWFTQSGYNFVHAGENLAIHFTDSTEVVDAWMDSPTHRANIVNGKYTEIGVGTAEGTFEGFKTVYVVQLFGTPAKDTLFTLAQKGASETIPVSPPTPTPLSKVPDEKKAVLAESVDVTSEVAFIKADPLPLPDDTPSDSDTQDMRFPVSDKQASTTHKEDMLSFMSTSTGAVPASIRQAGEDIHRQVPYVLEMLTQPTVLLQMVYGAVAVFVLVALMFSIGIEFRRHHPVQIAYSMALVLLMFGLLRLHELLSAGVVIV